MELRLVHLIPLSFWPNEVLQSAAPEVDPWSICPTSEDETDLFSRCFEHLAHACHITQSQRCMSVTAVLTNTGMMPNRLTQLRRNEVQDWGPSYLSCLQNLDLTFGRKGSVQHGLVNSKIHDLAGRVEKMRHCCMKLDVQKGGGSERSPTILKTCKRNALMSASSKSRSLCVNMTLPLWNK